MITDIIAQMVALLPAPVYEAGDNIDTTDDKFFVIRPADFDFSRPGTQYDVVVGQGDIVIDMYARSSKLTDLVDQVTDIIINSLRTIRNCVGGRISDVDVVGYDDYKKITFKIALSLVCEND